MTQMRIRYVCSDQEQETDAALTDAATLAIGAGMRLTGTVQPVDGDNRAEKCHIILALLPDGERCDISLPLEPGMTGCRLDAGALEDVAVQVQDRLPDAQCLLVNKFGKQEAVGRGLVTAIGEACERGLPVVVGVSPQWLAAFQDFAGDAAEPLPADASVIVNWLDDACGASAA
ncbi:MAG: DUF2478 domain-containing protein [Paracoccus sp. (in: a-proteobacteria)]|nr:DUF2478 domain-containing protein [Paracoccus sp. (in: a-proteobacteria)]